MDVRFINVEEIYVSIRIAKRRNCTELRNKIKGFFCVPLGVFYLLSCSLHEVRAVTGYYQSGNVLSRISCTFRQVK